MKKIAIFDYITKEIIIIDVPIDENDIESYISENFDYSISNIQWFEFDKIDLNGFAISDIIKGEN